jgi:peptidoglycan/xylan/chitin deacetylase (PgdA/CDA1 family)
MLNFRNTNLVFVIITAAAVWYDLDHELPWYTYLLIFLVYSLILFYGSYYIASNFYIKVICSVPANQKQIAISFDDGPAENYTPEILNILKTHEVEAAFFCIGSRVSEHEQLVAAIAEQGHIIGNHSFSHHFWFDLFSTSKMMRDLRMMDLAVQEATGLKPRLFRPPYGVTNPNLAKAIVKGGYIPVGWSIRSMDTIIKDEVKLLKKVLSAIKPGSIVLFHDTSKATVSMLPEFLRTVKEQGYEIIRPDKMLNVKAYA